MLLQCLTFSPASELETYHSRNILDHEKVVTRDAIVLSWLPQACIYLGIGLCIPANARHVRCLRHFAYHIHIHTESMDPITADPC